jgi:hypothetical protein
MCLLRVLLLHRAVVGDVADASEDDEVSIFMAKLCKLAF